MLFCYGILVLSKDKQNKTKRQGEMKMFEIYIKKTPISKWQYIGEVATQDHANKVYNKANANGYYCKIVAKD